MAYMFFSEFHYVYEDGIDNSPIITLEVLSDSSNVEHCDQFECKSEIIENEKQNALVHFASDTNEIENSRTEQDDVPEENKDAMKTKPGVIEYLLNNDGSVICKLCGEVLASRTHWYRHKYKLHVIQTLNPAPLFQCEQCLVFFKSRKGYIGHIASRHSELLADSNPVLTNEQAEALQNEAHAETPINPVPNVKEEPDVELEIPKSSVPNPLTTTVVRAPPRTVEKKPHRRRNTCEQTNMAEFEEKRSREEKLITEIIDRVRRECEAQGVSGPARRCYSRRANVT